MVDAISLELSRLMAEKSSKQAEKEEIRSELLDRGDIKRYWDEKIYDERKHGVDLEKFYAAARHELEQELNLQEKNCGGDLKEKAALDCQRQLLLNLKLEVDEMSKRLESEKALYMKEKSKLLEKLCNLQTQQEGLLDTKSILEAEKEAIRIMR